MTDSKLLKKLIHEKGLKIGFLVKKLNTSYAQFSRKVNNEKPFTAEEIQVLCDVLRINDLRLKNRIFFAVNVEKNSTR